MLEEIFGVAVIKHLLGVAVTLNIPGPFRAWNESC